ncbi:hypothetical protein B0J13DRAFT_516027 [Dactylonectria estremocensis]|uniref:Nephrocystin 3-like N-terminal domain-containing protein n=1 Tax=Dactylonectria estremocensis TaxID=1079267 RepID=A0A9P9D3S5_9HYPO|nr:hypothetical protein B0J13DRAFT_516027 [Dactylonectria estremocensis]
MEAIGVAANVIAVVDISIKVASLCVQYAKDVKNAAADIERLKNEVANLEGVAKEVKKLLDNPNSARLDESQRLKNNLDDTRLLLKTLHLRLTPRTSRKAMSKIGLRALKWPFQSKEVDDLVETLRRYAETIDRTLQVGQTDLILHIDETMLSIDQKTVLGRLPIATGASFDSRSEEHNPTCLQDTRVDLLRQIHEWANDPCAKAIFWLNGMAGTGKSTISRTVARSFDRSGYLGASFFFKRGEADRGSLSKFCTTIAAQLAKREPTIMPHIKAAIDAAPDIAEKAVRQQFDKLIMQPMRNIHRGVPRPVILAIIIDALDECDRDEDIKLIINLFSGAECLQTVRLRIFVTSRPDLPIRLGFKDIEGTFQNLILHEIPEEIVKQDIIVYLEHELRQIRRNHKLPETWPSQHEISTLAQTASPLFIAAVTICRFLRDDRLDPTEQLLEVMRYRPRRPYSNLDAIYRFVLDRLIDGLEPTDKARVIRNFRSIVGSIIILASPLSTSALKQMLQESIATIDRTLKLLHSVLSIPSSDQSPVRLLHLSFRDFLLDPKKVGENPFYVDERQAHEQMAANCLRVLNGGLRTDVCKLSWPGTDRSSISPQDIASCIPTELQYACLYWVSHIQQAGMLIDDSGPVSKFLLQHFLHWLEALSLIGRASESVSIIKVLQSVLKLEGSEMLEGFLQDALRLILTNVSIIDSTPLQIYSSVLAFTPKNSAVRKAFFQDHQIPKWISLAPEPEDNWDQCQQILEGHINGVTSVAFSHDSTVVASASDDKTIRLWRVHDGTCIQELKGHTEWVTSVAFSHDSTAVASASGDKTIRLWRVHDGTCIQELKGHTDWVTSVAFSHDSTVVASASYDKTIRLWRVHDGTCIQELKGHTESVTSVAFSHDSTVVASASWDETIRLWRVKDGACLQEVTGISSSHLQFDPRNSSLLTDAGPISFNSPILSPESITIPFTHCLSGVGISEDRCWIMWKKKRLLWLPAPFRPQCLTVSGSSVILGCSSGRVIFMRFVDLWLLD